MKKKLSVIFLLLLCLIMAGCSGSTSVDYSSEKSISAEEIPAYSGEGYVVINDNEPAFDEEDLTTEAFETYSPLDNLGRCGVAYANLCQELMPTEERGSISSVYPSGWHSVQYDNVEGKSLYNRSHLIGFQLAGENANEENLITGTRYMNATTMLPFENMVADYIKETNHHVLYRVSPIFDGDDLVAQGVQMEAFSVEDEGEGICFNIFAYNIQPGIEIDYATGDSWQIDEEEETSEEPESSTKTYILNTNSKKFHDPDCRSVDDMSESNKETYKGSRSDLINQGYEPCKNCNP